jgi:iron complex transport system ATP-binding protein
MTVLLITHGLDTVAQFADRLILLSSGRVVAEGTPADVMREDTLREVYGWRISVSADPVTGAPRVSPQRAPRPGASR